MKQRNNNQIIKDTAMMRMRIVSYLLLLSSALVMVGCKVEANLPANEAQQVVSVDIKPVVVSDITDSIDIVGTLDPKFASQVKAEYQGIVNEVYITEWVSVKKGDPLAKLDTRDADLQLSKAKAGVEMAQAGLLQANVNADRANREYERATKLKEHGLITQQSFDDISSMKDAATSGVAASKAQLKVAEEDLKRAETFLDKAVIKSPMDGVVSFRGISVGDLAGDMSSPYPLFKIIDLTVFNLTVTVPSSRMGDLRIGQELTFTTDAYPTKEFSGKVMFINPSVDEVSRAVKVVAEVPNETGELRASLFVRGKIIVAKRTGVIQVPRQALLSWDTMKKQAEIFVVENDVAHRRNVATGVVVEDMVEITTGLSSGEKVITRGGFNVRDGEAVKSIEEQGA